MSSALVEKLMKSFDELDRCISLTLTVFSQKEDVPDEVVARVKQYSSIVIKQRSLASELEAHVSAQNWREVSRVVKVINGLSGMIRDDAQSILNNAAGDSAGLDTVSEVSFC